MLRDGLLLLYPHYNYPRTIQTLQQSKTRKSQIWTWMGLWFESCQVIEYYTRTLKNGMLHRWNEVQWQRRGRIWSQPRFSASIPGTSGTVEYIYAYLYVYIYIYIWNINGQWGNTLKYYIHFLVIVRTAMFFGNALDGKVNSSVSLLAIRSLHVPQVGSTNLCKKIELKLR